MNLEKNVELVELFDCYKNMLTEKQQQVFNLYVLNDLSLQEVSELLNISRQAIKYTLDATAKTLNNLEQKLSVKKNSRKIKLELTNITNEIKDKNINKKIKKIIDKL